MGRIVRLPEAVANQIAAGEVVERPASVVKELLENSIDAGAMRIDIDIEGGGVDLIRIVDDGGGMDRGDAERSLERHATSKLRTAADLEGVSTLGFRGEALPSIASVSRFTMVTKPGGGDATKLVVEGGKTISVGDAGAPDGTTIEVRDLFFNVPARRKFLKKPQTELSHITHTIERIALAQDHLALRLTHQGRVLFDVAAASATDPRGRLSRILGKTVADSLHPLTAPEPTSAVRVGGWISQVSHSERTTRGLHVFVNGRFVRDRTIHHAIQSAYRTLLEPGRHPVVVLMIEVDAGLIDVNVHPQKTEVRFSETSMIHRAVGAALSATLSAQPWMARPKQRRDSYPAIDAGRSADPRDRVADSGSWPASPASERLGAAWNERFSRVGPVAAVEPSQASLDEVVRGRFSQLEPVGVVLERYYVLEGRGRMVLLDAQAAEARVVLERLESASRSEAGLESQPLMIPQRFELDGVQARTAEASRERLARIGFDLANFGGATWVLKAVPPGLGRVDVAPLTEDLLEALAAGADDPQLLSIAADHASRGPRTSPSRAEIRALLVELDGVDFAQSDERSVLREWTDAELARLFDST